MAVITTEQLREEANKLGITYTAKTTDDVLLSKIEEARENQAKLKAIEEAAKARKEATLKKRVKVVPLNPVETNAKSKLFSVMNSEMDETVVVYFNKPWFLTNTMIEHIKSLQYISVPSNLDSDGKADKVEKVLLPAYSIVDLGPISEAEFKEMKETKLLNNSAYERTEG